LNLHFSGSTVRLEKFTVNSLVYHCIEQRYRVANFEREEGNFRKMSCIHARNEFPALEKYLKSTSMWFHKSYLLDWFLSLALFVIVQGVTMFVSPFHRYLPPNDPSVLYPNENDIVSNALLMILSIVLPVVIFALAQIYFKNGQDCHHAMLGLFVSISLTNVITASVKSATGRYRPNWYSTYAPGDLNEGRYSFPSGHASNSFAGMVFLSLYILGKSRIFRNECVSPLWKSLLALSPLIVAFFIAVSRTVDYHHNFSDIIAGSLIGTGFSFFGYFSYFPSLFSDECHLPKQHPECKLMANALPILQQIVVPSESNKKIALQEYEGYQTPM